VIRPESFEPTNELALAATPSVENHADYEQALRNRVPFPSALTILALVAVVVWALGFIIPAGEYRLDEEGAPVAGTYKKVAAPQTLDDRVGDLVLSPVNGLYGLKDEKTGRVAPNNSGGFYGSAAVFLFVLAIGAFVTVTRVTGGLDRGIAHLAHRMRSHGGLLIVVIMSVFSLLGTLEGFAEETLGFYAVVIPLVVALGFDRMVAVGTIILGAGVGVMAGTVNPFAVGIASSAANISIGDGIVGRVLMWLLLTGVTIAYVLRYAHKVRANPTSSLVGFAPGEREHAARLVATKPAPLTARHKLVVALVGLTFAVLLFSVIPWASIIYGPQAMPFPWQLDWHFAELTALFIGAAIVVGLVGGLGERRLTDTLATGAGDFVYPALVILLARGVAVIMNNSQIDATVLHSMESVVSQTSSGLFAVLVFVVNLPLAFLIPSSSGHATLAIPILAPLGDFAHVRRSIVISGWDAASGWAALITPTTAVVMGGIALARVGYTQYLRFVLPLLAILAVLVCATLFIEATVPLP
jgi:uncharacterized ion transporter superfamily protein YfcC